VPRLRPSLRVAQEVGARLEGRRVLLRALPTQQVVGRRVGYWRRSENSSWFDGLRVIVKSLS